MFRKIYIDLLREKFSEGRLAWLARVVARYPLIQLSQLVRRPLCGPILGTLVTNYSCNCRCSMCELPTQDRSLRDEHKGSEPFGTKEMRVILEEFQSLGILGVGFTGGEPLLRSDILELLTHCRRLGMLTHLNTNGLLLDDQVARELVRIGVDSVNVSLDGATAATHDDIRGVPGAFEGATGAIRRLIAVRGKRTAPRVKAVMVVQQKNYDEIQEVAQTAAGLGTDCVEYIPEQPFSTEGAKILPDGDVQMVRSALGSLLRSSPLPLENSVRMTKLIPWTMKGRESPLRCHSGFNSLTMDCYGRVFPCLPWLNWDRNPSYCDPSDLSNLWRSDGYGRLRLETVSCRDCTLNCQAELNLLFNPLRRIPEASE